MIEVEKRLVPYQDFKPLHITIDSEDVLCFGTGEQIAEYALNYPKVPVTQLGRLSVAMFRGSERMPNASEFDYMGIQRYTEEGEELLTLDFNNYEFLVYAAGFALPEQKDRVRALYFANRELGSFNQKYGWNPQVVIADEPTELDQRHFYESESAELDDPNQLKGFLDE